MLVRSDAGTLGTVGGGYVEAEVRRQGLHLLRQGGSALLDLSLDHEYGPGEGPICGGRMFIAVASISPDAVGPFSEALDLARRRRPASVPLIVEYEHQRLAYRLHLEAPPTLLIAGAGHVGQAVARLAVDLGFHVVVIDDRAEWAAKQRFPAAVELVVDDVARALREYPIDGGCYVVIATHGHHHDQQALAAVISRPAAYVGMIASQRKSRTILRNLAKAGAMQEHIDSVHTPIGLPIGAVTVPEIAISIAAELVQAHRRNAPSMVEGPVEVSKDAAS